MTACLPQMAREVTKWNHYSAEDVTQDMLVSGDADGAVASLFAVFRMCHPVAKVQQIMRVRPAVTGSRARHVLVFTPVHGVFTPEGDDLLWCSCMATISAGIPRARLPGLKGET